ncbi:hypothetical protein [Blastomonas sp.]|uniref:hypothetical protein n=1 Tax=Blastomonas sp. TaxID=1909299 RepID=UPI003594391F
MSIVYSRAGRIGGNAGTTAADLDALFEEISAAETRHLVVHFHGGLVNEVAGEEVARRLEGRYRQEGFPVFFVWRSGVFDALRQSLKSAAEESAFKQATRKIAEWITKKAVKKLPMGNAVASGDGLQALTHNHLIFSTVARATGVQQNVADQINQYWSAPHTAQIPLAGLADEIEDFLVVDESEIEADLRVDAAFITAINALRPTAQKPEKYALMLEAGTDAQVGAPPNAVRAALFNALVDEAPTGAMGAQRFGLDLLTLVKSVQFIYRVVKAVIKRVKSDRHHDIYPTIIEELLRHLKIGGDGLNEWAKMLLWNEMKDDTADAFKAEENAVGTEFLQRLAGNTTIERVTLVGHSTGAIYIANWLKTAKALAPNRIFDVIFLAPAITYTAFNEALNVAGDSIGRFRMFSMCDELEKKDQVWGADSALGGGRDIRRFIYPCSLLYLVSGLLESKVQAQGHLVDEPDMPILGMARFFDRTNTFDAQHFPEVHRVREWLRADPGRTVWSATADDAPLGYRSHSEDHGSFDEDVPTINSVVECLGGRWG